MTATDQRTYRFDLGPAGYGFAMGHETGGVTLSLQVWNGPTRLDTTVRIPPGTARAIASALYEAADSAEDMIADTDFDPEREAERVRLAREL